MTRYIIDCDPGHDDAMAILYAAAHLDVVGLTTVAGNSSLENSTRNALAICTLAGLKLPVVPGLDRALIEPPLDGAYVHGATGIDGAELPAPSYDPLNRHAVDFIIETARATPGELSLIAIGPLSNVALALRLEPKLVGWLKSIAIMGGSTTSGNRTPYAEFNIVCDPEAAAIVFGAGVPLSMVGLNITRQAGIAERHIARLRQGGGRVSSVMADLLAFYLAKMQERYGTPTAAMHDPCAVIPLVRPELITFQALPVHIELGDGPLRGMTACDSRPMRRDHDQPGASRPANCDVAVAVDGEACVDAVIDTILGYDRP
ncbi:nucleoside hydrolase [Bosea sp. NPDC055332]